MCSSLGLMHIYKKEEDFIKTAHSLTINQRMEKNVNAVLQEAYNRSMYNDSLKCFNESFYIRNLGFISKFW